MTRRCGLVLLAVCCALLACSPLGLAHAATNPTAPKTTGGATTTGTAATAATAAAPKSYYDLLGVTAAQASDAAVLKRAYRKLALAHHPDKAGSEAERAEKQEIFVRLANAYEVLSSTRLRLRYEFLVSQGQMEYDGQRDWREYDRSRGFKVKPKSKAQQDAEFKFKQAAEIFKKAQEEAEEFALWSSLIIALGVALLPAGWMFYSRRVEKAQAVAQRKARSSELKASQTVLAEMQAEQAREAAQRREEERAYQQELRKARAEAAAAAAAAEQEDEDSAAVTSPSEDAEWEVVDGIPRRRGSQSGDGDAAAGGADDRDSSEEEESSSSSKTVVKCVLCKKSFKSQQQLENHENSNQHKKAVKDAEKTTKKKARREE